MKSALLLVLLCLSGCSTIQKFPSAAADAKPFEYCDGELWGYMLPLGPRESKPWFSRQLDDPMPLLAVYLHLRSDLAKDPSRALQLFLDVHSRSTFTIEVPKQDVVVNFENGPERRVETKFQIFEQTKSASELYPSPKYEVRLLDPARNRWRITKVNPLFYLIKGESEEKDLPQDRIYPLSAKANKISFNDEQMKAVWVRATENIWPVDEPLRTSKIVVRVPEIRLNGQSIEPRELTFDLNYEAVAVRRANAHARVCPSAAQIFMRND